MKSSTTFVTLLLMLFTSLVTPHTAKAQMGPRTICYITIEGQSQGQIKGEVRRKGMESKIAGFGFSFSEMSPRDLNSGMASGHRVHTPIKITKGIDIASPKLLQALVSNETLKTVTLEFWGPSQMTASGMGSEVKYYTVKLTNASITAFNQTDGTFLPENDQKTEKALEELTLTYQKIEITSTDGSSSASAMYDWK